MALYLRLMWEVQEVNSKKDGRVPPRTETTIVLTPRGEEDYEEIRRLWPDTPPMGRLELNCGKQDLLAVGDVVAIEMTIEEKAHEDPR